MAVTPLKKLVIDGKAPVTLTECVYLGDGTNKTLKEKLVELDNKVPDGGSTDPNSHTHANKTVLDGITEQKVAEWDAINIGILASNDGTQFILRVNNDGTLYTERTYIPEVALPSDFPKYVFTGGSTHEDDFLITPHTDNQNLGYIFIMNKKGQVKWYKKLTSFAYSFKKCKNKAGKIRYCYHQTINKEYPKFSMNGGYDNNKLVVMDENYNIIDEAKLQPYGSLQSVTPCENHDYLFIDDEHYILTAYTANVVNNIPGVTGDIRVVNVVIQELKNNEVVWQFESKDDTELYTASHTNNNYAKFSTTQNINTDYAHLNSVVLDKRDGNLLTSWRHIGLIKIERFTGKILWVMGRNRNDITGSTTAQCGYLQHDARYNNDYSITIFDNSGCATNNTRFCRYWIDEANKAITKFEGVTSTRARSPFMGSAKIINEPNNVYEVAYGGAWKDIAFEQYDFKNNKQLMKLVFNEGHDLYRVFSGIEDYSWDNAEKPTVPLNSISIPTALKLNVNEEQTLAVTYNPPDARNKQVTFKSDQPLIAKVDTTGKVTGLSDGLAVIICTSDEGSYTSQCVVTVEAQTISVTGVALSQLSASINVDATLDLTATIQPNGANNKNVSWSCNNSNVNIIPNGLKCTVTGARTGESIVTVTTEEHSYTDSCSINISENTLENYAAYLIQGKSSVGCAFTNHVAATSIDCQGFECSPKFLGFDFPTNTLGTDTTYMFCESLLTVTDTEKKNNNIECIAGAREGVKNFLTVKILKTKATTPDNFKTYFNDNPTHINIRLKENVKKYMIDINNIELVNTTHSAPGYTCGEFIASDLPFATCTEDKVYIPNLGYSNDWGGSANWSYFKISEWQGSVYVGFQIRNELLETQDLEGIRKYISKSPYIYYIN